MPALRLFAFLFGELTLLAFGGSVGAIAIVDWYGRDLPDPNYLKNYVPASVTRLYSGDGAVLGEYSREQRIFVAVGDIPPLVRDAFVSAEDKNFYVHRGVDVIGIAKAMVRNVGNYLARRRFHGASTITQQVMKIFLTSGEYSLERKIKEALLALRIEKTMSKDRILEIYLNEIFFGARSYGVAVAAKNYFGKTLDELLPEEAAYLAAIPKAPSRMHPVRNRGVATARRNYVLREMAENGYISREAAEKAAARPLVSILGTKGNEKAQKRSAPDISASYFAEEVRRDLVRQYGRKAVYEDGLSVHTTLNSAMQTLAEHLLRDGLVAHDRTTGYRGPVARIAKADRRSEAAWRAALTNIDAPRDIRGWHLAVVLEVRAKEAVIGIEGEGKPARLSLQDAKEWARKPLPPERPAEGEASESEEDEEGGEEEDHPALGPVPEKAADIWNAGDVIYVTRLRAGGKNGKGSWSMRQVPETQGALLVMNPRDGRILAMQGGLSFLRSRFNRATQAERQPGSAFKPFVYGAALENGLNPAYAVADRPISYDQGPDLPRWQPRNYTEKFYGCSPLRLGIEFSRNLMTVRIADQIGMGKVAQFAERLGVYDSMPLHISYSLGAGETTLIRLMGAYSVFVNGGNRVTPRFIDRVQDRAGRIIARHTNRHCDNCAGIEWERAQSHPPLIETETEPLIDSLLAYQILSMMQGVTSRGTASRLGRLGFATAGKTGTTNDSRDAWFIGFTPDLAVGCFIGYDKPRSLGKDATGGGLCAPIFERFMRSVKAGRTPRDFPVPQGAVFAKVDRWTGQRLPESAEGGRVIREVFSAGQLPPVGHNGGGSCHALAGRDSGEGAPSRGIFADEPVRPEARGTSGETADDPSDFGLGTGGLY